MLIYISSIIVLFGRLLAHSTSIRIPSQLCTTSRSADSRMNPSRGSDYRATMRKSCPRRTIEGQSLAIAPTASATLCAPMKTLTLRCTWADTTNPPLKVWINFTNF
ncbi:hypothetical protein V1506DRAFT_540292 [Lipomyces tetrasporus]